VDQVSRHKDRTGQGWLVAVMSAMDTLLGQRRDVAWEMEKSRDSGDATSASTTLST
jgi:hypothetical protein